MSGYHLLGQDLVYPTKQGPTRVAPEDAQRLREMGYPTQAQLDAGHAYSLRTGLVFGLAISVLVVLFLGTRSPR